jgi:hypothetical protein
VSIDLSGYNDVAARMIEFREKYPEGCLQPIDPAKPFEVVTVGDKVFIAYTAAAYRTADDPRPGIGVAWESFPGRTNYTRDSELMNAETSAWGRAILAVGAADAKKGIASAEEVRNRSADREQWDDAKPAQVPPERARQNILANARTAIAQADEPSLHAIDARISDYLGRGAITTTDAAEMRHLHRVRLDLLHHLAGEHDDEVLPPGVPVPRGDQAAREVGL